LTVLGAVFPHFCPDKREIWRGPRAGPLPRVKFHVYQDNVSPLRGEKPIFGPLSKNNTGMAALRADLPIKRNIIFHILDVHFPPLQYAPAFSTPAFSALIHATHDRDYT